MTFGNDLDSKISSGFRFLNFKCNEMNGKIAFLARSTKANEYGHQLSGDIELLRKRIQAWEAQWESNKLKTLGQGSK